MGPNPLGPGEFAVQDGVRGILIQGEVTFRLLPDTLEAVLPACNVYVFGSDDEEHPSNRLFREAWVFAQGEV